MDGLSTSASRFLGGKQNLPSCTQPPTLPVFVQEIQWYLLTVCEMEGLVCLLSAQNTWGGGTWMIEDDMWQTESRRKLGGLC